MYVTFAPANSASGPYETKQGSGISTSSPGSMVASMAMSMASLAPTVTTIWVSGA